MTRDPRERLLDIRDAVDAIESHAGGSLTEPNLDSAIALHAVLFNLMVIGEAAKNVGDDLKALAPEVPWDDVAGLRDVIAHRYFRIEREILEETVRRDLPALSEAVARMLPD